MKLWTNNEFEGYDPVGTAAVVVADTAEEAAEYLNMFLAEKNLPNTTADLMKEMPFVDGQVRILCDGDY